MAGAIPASAAMRIASYWCGLRNGLAGLPAFVLYAGAAGFGAASLRDPVRAARWTVAAALALVAGLLATFAWLISMLDALS